MKFAGARSEPKGSSRNRRPPVRNCSPGNGSVVNVFVPTATIEFKRGQRSWPKR